MPAQANAVGNVESSATIFQEEWALYRKIVDNNYLFHSEAYHYLHHLLTRDAPDGFRFLDIACGDATSSIKALHGTKVGSYCGIDLSAAALALAGQNLASLGCPIELI